MSTLTIPKPKLSAAEFLAAQRIAQDVKRQHAIVPYSTNTALDAFNNQLARIGYGTNNLLESTNYPLTRLSYNWYLLISLYRDNWLVSKTIDGIADAMVNKWINFPTDLPPQKVKRLEQVMVRTGTQNQVLTALKWARLFGGAGAVMIVKNSGPLDKPLKFDDVPLDSFRGLIVFDRWSGISPSSKISSDLDFPLDYGLPETYRINLERGGSFEVHSSRILRFTGRIMPAWEFQADQRWGVSEIERVFQELKKRDNTSYNLASLIFRANIFELRQKGLSQMISGLNASAQAQKAFADSIQAQTQLMSNQGIVVSDPEGGGLSTHQYGFSGIADVYALFQRDWCAASEYPYSLMFGREGGLGQSNEGDEHAFYDSIGQKQKREIDPQFRKLIPTVAMSTWGKVPDDLEWKWNPVNNPSDKQKAELATATSQSVVAVFNAGIVSQKTAGEELKQAASTNGLWDNITDEDIAAMSEEALGGEMQAAALMPPMPGEGEEGAPPEEESAPPEDGDEVPPRKSKANGKSKKHR
jgi:phage-related protein (TIGR01555 family)